jgi:hypothetical protein
MKRYINEAAAAEYLGNSVHTLRAWRQRGVGPPYIRHGHGRSGKFGKKEGRNVRYDIERLDAFMEKFTVETDQGI